eukprot:CAMPEP_0172551504 /NCGR_PEP_ID=MMETSP1067-20121228/40042_1 /TAXON_ID=265564 ORGANISM="Thalassiosira punctigera, Strain Tpunct2005C2" /NCGR_SAMPLE_ID=MMETSP1067 /ASSEMBLY_ACC=CAM_ASM_000444 /LENGTH=313 /DNA_ID=CAMNT_0013339305 /DNA_START=136 /DNA_END=1077 /DNA_ORIENTATION=+
MTLLKKKSSTASLPLAKKAKTNAFFNSELMMSARRQQHQQLGIISPSTIMCRGSTTQDSPSASPRCQSKKVKSSIVTPCMSSPRGALSLPEKNATPSLSSLPAPPFETARDRTGATSRNPLEILSHVSSQIADKVISTPVTVGTKGGGHPSYLGDRNSSGQRHGRGIMRYDNGCRYVGVFANDKRHGYGKVWYPDGLGAYVGHWRENKRHGAGTMSFANGDVYEGRWSADRPNGMGKLTMTNGETYTGEFVARQKHGRGVYRWPNGDVYEGEWAKDAMHGSGVMISANGDVCNRVYYQGVLLLRGDAAEAFGV